MFLVSNHKFTEFQARSSHPLLSKTTWSHTDIALLAKRVEEDIQKIVADHSGDRWQPAIVLEITPDINQDARVKSASVKISSYAVALDTLSPPTNEGRRRILQEGVSGNIQERTINDDAHVKVGTSRIRLESNSSRTVLLETKQINDKIASLQTALEAFGRKLGKRISPDRVNPADLPDPEELVVMMREAVNQSD